MRFFFLVLTPVARKVVSYFCAVVPAYRSSCRPISCQSSSSIMAFTEAARRVSLLYSKVSLYSVPLFEVESRLDRLDVPVCTGYLGDFENDPLVFNRGFTFAASACSNRHESTLFVGLSRIRCLLLLELFLLGWLRFLFLSADSGHNQSNRTHRQAVTAIS